MNIKIQFIDGGLLAIDTGTEKVIRGLCSLTIAGDGEGGSNATLLFENTQHQPHGDGHLPLFEPVMTPVVQFHYGHIDITVPVEVCTPYEESWLTANEIAVRPIASKGAGI